jgi:hypothetical protein
MLIWPEKTFKSCDRRQMLLRPSLMDWLPKGHLSSLRHLLLGWLRLGCGLAGIEPIYCPPVAARNQVSIDVNGHLDAGVTQLFIHVDWTGSVAQKQACRA